MGFYQTYGGRPVSQQIEVTEEKRNVYDDCNRLTDRWYHTSFSPSTLCLVLCSVWHIQSYLIRLTIPPTVAYSTQSISYILILSSFLSV